MKSLYEQMGGTYHLGAYGMYYPDLELPEEESPRYGKYGRMRHTYLREHKKAYYTILLFYGKLVAHLNKIDDAANVQMEQLTKQMAKSQGVTEALKAQDQLAWVGAMNNIRSAAEEIVLSELVCNQTKDGDQYGHRPLLILLIVIVPAARNKHSFRAYADSACPAAPAA